MKRLLIFIAVSVASLMLIDAVFFVVMYNRNMSLADELDAGFRKWLEDMPSYSDNANGVPLLLEGAGKMLVVRDIWDMFHFYEFDPGNSVHIKLFSEYREKNREAVKLIDKALEAEYWKYNLNYNDAVMMILDDPYEVSKIQYLNGILFKGSVAINDIKNAHDTVVRGLRTAGTYRNDPSLVLFLCQFNLTASALDRFHELLEKDLLSADRIHADGNGFWNPTAEGIRARFEAFDDEDARREMELDKNFRLAIIIGIVLLLIHVFIMLDQLHTQHDFRTFYWVAAAVCIVMIVAASAMRGFWRMAAVSVLYAGIISIFFILFYFSINAIRFFYMRNNYICGKSLDQIALFFRNIIPYIAFAVLYGLVRSWLIFGKSGIMRMFVQVVGFLCLVCVILFFILPFTADPGPQEMLDSIVHRAIWWVLFFAWRIAALVSILLIFMCVRKPGEPLWKKRFLSVVRFTVALAFVPYIWGLLRIAVLSLLEWTFPKSILVGNMIITAAMALPLLTAFVVFDFSGRLALARWRRKIKVEKDRMNREATNCTQ